MEILYKEDLDLWKCDNPDCKHDHENSGMVAVCDDHPEAGTLTLYVKGSVVVLCKECESPVAIIAVKSKLDIQDGQQN